MNWLSRNSLWSSVMVVEKLGDSSYSTIYSFQPKRRAPGTVAHDSHMHGHMTCIDRHGNGIKLEPKWYLPLVNLRFHPAEVEGIYTALSSSPPITYCPPPSSPTCSSHQRSGAECDQVSSGCPQGVHLKGCKREG